MALRRPKVSKTSSQRSLHLASLVRDFNQVDPMTLEQYLNLLANNEEEFPLGLS